MFHDKIIFKKPNIVKFKLCFYKTTSSKHESINLEKQLFHCAKHQLTCIYFRTLQDTTGY